MTMPRVLAVVGTRPEAIKLVPVLQKLRAHPDTILQIVSTAQHRQMLDQVFDLFNVQPDIDLDIMRPNQNLNQIVQSAIGGLDRVMDAFRPDIVLVQGDTTTAFAAALAAFDRRIEVAHLEAGLRSHDRYNPYPEEINRRLISQVATIHFAPTAMSADNLVLEGIPESCVYLTGNTVVDCLLGIAGVGEELLQQVAEVVRGEVVVVVLAVAVVADQSDHQLLGQELRRAPIEVHIDAVGIVR